MEREAAFKATWVVLLILSMVSQVCAPQTDQLIILERPSENIQQKRNASSESVLGEEVVENVQRDGNEVELGVPKFSKGFRRGNGIFRPSLTTEMTTDMENLTVLPENYQPSTGGYQNVFGGKLLTTTRYPDKNTSLSGEMAAGADDTSTTERSPLAAEDEFQAEMVPIPSSSGLTQPGSYSEITSTETTRSRVLHPTEDQRYQARIVVPMVYSSGRPFDYELIGPALEMAKETAELLYSNIRFHIVYRNASNRCTARWASFLAAEEYYQHNISAFIGPGCSAALEPLGILAARWNIAVLTAAGSSQKLGDKDMYRTLTRLSHTMTRVTDFALRILNQYQWRHVAVIFDSTWSFSRVLAESFEGSLVDQSEFQITHHAFNDINNNELYEVLTQARQYARVFFLAARGDVIRQLLLAAYNHGFNTHEYVFLSVELFGDIRAFGNFDWYDPDDTAENNQVAREMYESFLKISLYTPTNPEYPRFIEEVQRRSYEKYSTRYSTSMISTIVGGFHDCLLLYAWALNQTLSTGHDPRNGSHIVHLLWNNTIDQEKHGGITGNISLSALGDRNSNYALNDIGPDGKWRVVVNWFGHNGEYRIVAPILWPGGGTSGPADVPRCGFRGDALVCRKPVFSVLHPVTFISLILACVFFSSLIGAVAYIKIKAQGEHLLNWWKLDLAELRLSEEETAVLCDAAEYNFTPRFGSVLPEVAVFKANLVYLKKIGNCKFVASKNDLQELKQIRDCVHDNLIHLYGVVESAGISYFVLNFCSKYSLTHFLVYSSLKLDSTLKHSIMQDVINGLHYLHHSAIGCHGSLRSTNTLLDGRFTVKLSGFGILALQNSSEKRQDPETLLWSAPEYLRGGDCSPTTSGDIYSLAIILQEITTRTRPYGHLASGALRGATAEDILVLVSAGSVPPFRPEVSRDICHEVVFEYMRRCWSEGTADRPSTLELKQAFSGIVRSSSNFLEDLLVRMEHYANNLEELVEEKSAAFLEEKKRSEQLLYQVLPRYIAEQLKAGNVVRPESFECVTILFSDIVDFTALSAESTPFEIVDFLNDLYTVFDKIISLFDVYKVETIGDAYMVVSGMPVRNGNIHVQQICRMSLSLLGAIKKFQIRHRPEHQTQLRIGVHSGPVAAGVVGLKMPRYCLFGDTVNTASRIESTGESMKIHISSETKQLLDDIGGFHTVFRGNIVIKGKGVIQTHWLVGEQMPLVSP